MMTPEDLRARLSGFPRAALGFWPTPLHELANLRNRYGPACPPLFVKRDDCTGLAGGGSKVRQLEFLMGDALRSGADVVVTGGSTSSNHVRLASAAARRLGLDVVVVLGGDMPPAPGNNVLFAHLAGADVRYVREDDPDRCLGQVAADLCRRGRRPYVIPVGGASPVGVLGYVLAAAEWVEQARVLDADPDLVVVASGSGGTQAGLALGLHLVAPYVRLVGVSVGHSAEVLRRRVADLAAGAAGLLGVAAPGCRAISVTDRFLAPGYPVPSQASLAACLSLARTEGLVVDPIYTGKAAAELLRRLDGGALGGCGGACFWHTGGLPNVFERADDLWFAARDAAARGWSEGEGRSL